MKYLELIFSKMILVYILNIFDIFFLVVGNFFFYMVCVKFSVVIILVWKYSKIFFCIICVINRFLKLNNE